jgi:endonuclease/exonuclease/phosphatase family metal-dependent hydrolase
MTVLLSGSGHPEESFLEMGSFASESGSAPETIRIVTYNVHGPLPQDIEAVYSVLNEDEQLQDAHIWALQEVRTDTTRNFTRYMAERLGMHYAHAIARPRGGGWEGLAFLSRFPIAEAQRLELPHLDTGERLRIGLFVTILVGNKAIRLCNVHLPIRMDHDKRAEQLRLILDCLDRHQLSAQVILGDFNTITGGLRRLYHQILEKRGFRTPFEGHAKTYQKYFFLRFKLDWIYLRGLESHNQGIEQKVKASDHRPVWVDLR